MFLKMETTSKKIMQPTTIKSKDNGCGTAPGNLVYKNVRDLLLIILNFLILMLLSFMSANIPPTITLVITITAIMYSFTHGLK